MINLKSDFRLCNLCNRINYNTFLFLTMITSVHCHLLRSQTKVLLISGDTLIYNILNFIFYLTIKTNKNIHRFGWKLDHGFLELFSDLFTSDKNFYLGLSFSHNVTLFLSISDSALNKLFLRKLSRFSLRFFVFISVEFFLTPLIITPVWHQMFKIT